MFLPAPTVRRSSVIIMLNDSAEVHVKMPTLASIFEHLSLIRRAEAMGFVIYNATMVSIPW